MTYVAAWAATGLVLAGGVVLALRGARDEPASVQLPPIEQTELRLAARSAGCRLRIGAGRRGQEPPVDGPRARPVPPGFYEDEQDPRALVGALRRGLVVISYQPDLPEELREQLREIQTAVPAGTIVAGNDRMPYEVAVTAWRRLLGCRRAGPETADALRLFRGRFLGSGPDSPR